MRGNSQRGVYPGQPKLDGMQDGSQLVVGQRGGQGIAGMPPRAQPGGNAGNNTGGSRKY